MKTKPVVLHTDDNRIYGKFAQDDLRIFDIDVESFTRNELAYEAAKQKVLPDGPYYDAVIADYETRSEMKGGQLIAALVKANLEGRPLVKDILVLSSSTNRQGILDELRNAFVEKELKDTDITQYMDSVQIFDKQAEGKLAELYVALHIKYPQESREIKRLDLIHWVGFKVDIMGDIRQKNSFDLDRAITMKFNLIKSGQLKLQDIVREVTPFCNRDLGKRPGMVR